MLDLGSWGEFLIIVIAALVLLGPKELPSLLRTLGRWVYRGKKAMRALKQAYEPFLHEGEIEEYIKDTHEAVMKEDPAQPSSSPEAPHEQ